MLSVPRAPLTFIGSMLVRKPLELIPRYRNNA